jgi:hypothetical protein
MTLNYTTQEINRDWRIKVFGRDEQGNKVNTLVGVDGLLRFFGIEFANKFLARAYNSTDDSCTCKLRRGIQVTFYNK